MNNPQTATYTFPKEFDTDGMTNYAAGVWSRRNIESFMFDIIQKYGPLAPDGGAFRAKLIKKFEDLQEKAESVRDRVYLDGVIAAIESEPGQ